MKKRNGKRSKRKSETNFVDAYSGASKLPPPPAIKDVTAVPAKLRKIMQMKSLVAKGQVQKKDPAGVGPTGSRLRDTRITNSEIKGERFIENSVPITEKRKRKREKNEAELSTLLEKMDRRVKTGISKGVAPRRKSFLEAKKRRKGQPKVLESDPPLDFHQHDKVEFGDIVQAPPKLSFPARAAQVKREEESQRHGVTFNEKSRQQAIEAYRQRKGWSSRLGGAQLPA